MKALLDTHTFLWWIVDDPQLSRRARQVMEDGATELFLSAASGWEMAIKSRLGKLKLPDDLHNFVAEQVCINALEVLPIEMTHALQVYSLPAHHCDPFDLSAPNMSGLEQSYAQATLATHRIAPRGGMSASLSRSLPPRPAPAMP